METFKRPNYPDLLLSKTWDKKKSLLGKAQVKKTGVGEAMDVAKKAYDAIKWEKLETLNNRPSIKDYSKDKWDALLNDAKAEVNGNVVKLRKAVDEVISLTKEAEKRFNEKKLKDDVKLAQEIMGVGNALVVVIQANALLPKLMAVHRDTVLPLLERVAESKKDLIKAVAVANNALLKIRESNFDPDVFGKNIGETRKPAQILGNIELYAKQGLDAGISGSEATALYKKFLLWRDGKPEFQAGEHDKVQKEVVKVTDALRETLQLCMKK